eukprot:945842-Amphidinium_carterae.1
MGLYSKSSFLQCQLGAGHQLWEVLGFGTFFGVVCDCCGGFSASRWRKLRGACPGRAGKVPGSLARLAVGRHPDPRCKDEASK